MWRTTAAGACAHHVMQATRGRETRASETRGRGCLSPLRGCVRGCQAPRLQMGRSPWRRWRGSRQRVWLMRSRQEGSEIGPQPCPSWKEPRDRPHPLQHRPRERTKRATLRRGCPSPALLARVHNVQERHSRPEQHSPRRHPQSKSLFQELRSVLPHPQTIGSRSTQTELPHRRVEARREAEREGLSLPTSTASPSDKE